MPSRFLDTLHSDRTTDKWDRLRRVVSPRDKVGIVLYGEPDPDALAAGWALQRLLQSHVQSSKIVASQPVLRNQNARLVKTLKMRLEVYSKIPWHDFTNIAVVDAQPNFFKPEPPVPFDIVIDHHPRKSHYSFKFSDVRPDYASVSTILLEYLVRAGIPVSKKMATALWFGLRTDSDNLSTPAHNSDLAAYGYLYRKSDKNIIQWLERSEVPISYKNFYKKALDSLDINSKRALVYLGDVPKPDACVMTADFLSRFIGIHWIAVAGVCNDTLFVILRSGSFGTDVGRIIKQKLSPFGSAGGHKDKARGEIYLADVPVKTDGDKMHENIETWLQCTLINSRKKQCKKIISKNNNEK